MKAHDHGIQFPGHSAELMAVVAGCFCSSLSLASIVNNLIDLSANRGSAVFLVLGDVGYRSLSS
ncbi:MAG: hypothetical protein WD668_04430 [Saccharospirillum sp.]